MISIPTFLGGIRTAFGIAHGIINLPMFSIRITSSTFFTILEPHEEVAIRLCPSDAVGDRKAIGVLLGEVSRGSGVFKAAYVVGDGVGDCPNGAIFSDSNIKCIVKFRRKTLLCH
jgi:hypothetical protein